MSILSVCSFKNVGNYILCCLFNNVFIKGLMTRPPCELLQAKVQKTANRPFVKIISGFGQLAVGICTPLLSIIVPDILLSFRANLKVVEGGYRKRCQQKNGLLGTVPMGRSSFGIYHLTHTPKFWMLVQLVVSLVTM